VDKRPEKLYGCEAWRALDWVNDDEKIVFDFSCRPNLGTALIGVFDSQISGGKRYDLAAQGRNVANATYLSSHNTDTMTNCGYGIDMSELIWDDNLDIGEYIRGYIRRFEDDVMERLGNM
jgi:hypothetical protein